MGEAGADLGAERAFGALPSVVADAPGSPLAVSEGGVTIDAARAGLESPTTYSAVAQLFGALADPTRARVVHLLMEREWSTQAIAAITGASEPATSQHLRVLRGLHLVRARRVGRWVYYRLDDAHVAALMRTSLAHLREAHQAPTVARPAGMADTNADISAGGASVAGMSDVSLSERIEAV